MDQKIDQNLAKALEELRLSQREITVFLELLRSGKATSADIARRHRDIPRTSIYDLLTSLQNLGMVSSATEGKHIYYQVQGVEHIVDVLETQKKEIETKQQQFRSIADIFNQIKSGSAYRPSVRFFEGKNGFVAMQREIANVRSPMRTIVDMAAVAKVFPASVFQDNLKDLFDNKVEKWDLMVKTKEAESYLQTARPTSFHRIKWLPSEIQFKTDTLVWEGHTAIMDYSENPSGVIIDNPAISQTFFAWFELMWNTIKDEVKL